jgi:hypothetical protein
LTCTCLPFLASSSYQSDHRIRQNTMKAKGMTLVVNLVVFAMLSLLAVRPTLNLSSIDVETVNMSNAQDGHQPSFSSSVRNCSPQKIGTLRSKSLLKSQDGEDEFALKWFNGLCNGTYLEMGAVDGVLSSNTYALHKAFGWKGLLIEMSPPNFKELPTNRPDDVTVNAAICDKPRTLHYWYNPERRFTAGIWEFTAKSFRDRYWQGVRLEDTTPINCAPLDHIIQERVSSPRTGHGRPHQYFFDFLSLDVEGGEMMVLKSVDFTTTAFGIMVVEADDTNHRKNLALRFFLENKGYRFLQQEERNYWFVNQNFAEIYADVLHGELEI